MPEFFVKQKVWMIDIMDAKPPISRAGKHLFFK
jgi:hypothetical protein